MDFEEARRFHFLYQKVSADLGRTATLRLGTGFVPLSGVARRPRLWRDPRDAPEGLALASAALVFAAISARLSPEWLGLSLSFWVTIAGMVFGGFAVALDDEAKDALLPAQFSHLSGSPAQRVAREERAKKDRLKDAHASFASQLMTHNINVSIEAMALGMIWGIGTIIILFYNGVMLGLVVVDYVLGGQTVFMLGWLLPHGVIEIPAILIGGQAELAPRPGGDRAWRPRHAGRASAGDLGRCGHADRRRRGHARLGGPRRIVPFPAPPAGGALLAEDRLWRRGIDRPRLVSPAQRSGSGSTPGRRAVPERPEHAMNRSSELRIRTPEGIVFSYALAGPITRCLAWAVDFDRHPGAHGRRGFPGRGVFCPIDRDLVIALSVIEYFLISTGYSIAMEWLWRGQTFGKRFPRLAGRQYPGFSAAVSVRSCSGIWCGRWIAFRSSIWSAARTGFLPAQPARAAAG